MSERKKDYNKCPKCVGVCKCPLPLNQDILPEEFDMPVAVQRKHEEPGKIKGRRRKHFETAEFKVPAPPSDTTKQSPRNVSALSSTSSDSSAGISGRPRTPRGISGRPRTPRGISGRPRTPRGISGRPRAPRGISTRSRTPRGRFGRTSVGYGMFESSSTTTANVLADIEVPPVTTMVEPLQESDMALSVEFAEPIDDVADAKTLSTTTELFTSAERDPEGDMPSLELHRRPGYTDLRRVPLVPPLHLFSDDEDDDTPRLEFIPEKPQRLPTIVEESNGKSDEDSSTPK